MVAMAKLLPLWVSLSLLFTIQLSCLVDLHVLCLPSPNTARPVPRKPGEGSLSRDALLAGAGVAVIGQRKKPHQLET